MPCQLPYGKFRIYEILQIADNPLITKSKAQHPMEKIFPRAWKVMKNVSERRLNGYTYIKKCLLV
jgi:hypothetical protein